MRRRPSAARAAAAALVALLACGCGPGAGAQDFPPAAPAGPQPGIAPLLDRALVVASPPLSIELSATRWLSLGELETRSAALAAGPGPVCVALGLSQTGDAELGWTALAVAAGLLAEDGGLAVRASARRDRAAGPLLGSPLAMDVGLEAGAGAWIAPAPALALWASAPQLYTTGLTPPLSRPLEVGARVRGADAAAWLSLGAPRAGDPGVRTAGLSLGPPSARLWAEVRDGPLRASLGARARAGAVVVEARVDAHPVLGETTRLAIAWRPGPGNGE